MALIGKTGMQWRNKDPWARKIAVILSGVVLVQTGGCVVDDALLKGGGQFGAGGAFELASSIMAIEVLALGCGCQHAEASEAVTVTAVPRALRAWRARTSP